MKDNKIIGEIIEVSSRSAIAQSYELYDCPPIGSVVKCGDDKEDIYGVITNIETRSIDPGRRPNPKGPGFSEVNELYKSNPEITHLMKTEFNIVFLGYKHGNTTTISIPPTPPRIFSFVSTLPEDEMINITIKNLTDVTVQFIKLFIEMKIRNKNKVLKISKRKNIY